MSGNKQTKFRRKIQELMRIGQDIGVDNPLGHYAYREIIMADILGHDQKTSKASEKTDEMYGADAIEPDGSLAEYKSKSVPKGPQKGRILKRKDGMVRLDGTYNGAYTSEAVERYNRINHYFSLWDPKIVPFKPLAIVQVNTDHVIDQLMDGVQRIQEQDEGSTNNNQVSVKINPASREFLLGDGEIFYLYDE